MAMAAARVPVPLSGRRARLVAAIGLLLVFIVGCRDDTSSGDLRIAAMGETAPSATRRGERATPTPQPLPPTFTTAAFRPQDGYTSMSADRRGVYWLGGGTPLRAAVVAAGPNGEDERVVARPGPGEAVGRPLRAGDWLVFPQTRDTSAAGGPWRLRAVHLLDGRDLEIDADRDGWEGLSHAVSGSRVAYTVTINPGPQAASEVRVWDALDGSRRVVLRTEPGVTLQRIAYDGQSAAAVRFVQAPDGSVATDTVELDLLGGQVLPLNATNAVMPAISRRYILWVTLPVGGAPNALVLYDRETRSRRQIAEARPGTSLFNPSITGSLVTWNATDTADVSLYDAAQNAVFPLDAGSVGKAWAQDGVVVWTALNPTTRTYEMRIATFDSP